MKQCGAGRTDEAADDADSGVAFFCLELGCATLPGITSYGHVERGLSYCR